MGVVVGPRFYVDPSNPLWDGLLAYYTADNTPNDTTGNGNDGTLVNGTTYGTGIINQGFSLDGVNDYVDLPNNTFKPNGDFSVSCWLKYDGSTNGWFIQVGDWTITTGFVLYFVNGVMRFTFGTSPGFYITTGPSANTNWTHYVFTYTNGETQIYENGNLFTTGTPTLSQQPVYPENCPVRFGSRTSNISNLYKGIIDEVGFWGRKITALEVTELYNSGVGKQYPN